MNITPAGASQHQELEGWASMLELDELLSILEVDKEEAVQKLLIQFNKENKPDA